MRLKTLASVAVIGLSSAALAQMTPHHGKRMGNMSNGMMSNSMMGDGMLGNGTMDNAVVTPDNSADTAKM